MLFLKTLIYVQNFLSAAFVSLRIILLVEMLGLNRLTNAYGFLLLFQGVAFMVSSPILGMIYSFSKLYLNR